jgi:hypothetical protein
MNRVWDYIGFTVWFAGLGYIVMWLFGSSDHLVLSPGLHAIGVAAAMFVPVRLVLRAVGARRLAAQTAIRPRKPAAVLRLSQRNRRTGIARSSRAANSACAVCRIDRDCGISS